MNAEVEHFLSTYNWPVGVSYKYRSHPQHGSIITLQKAGKFVSWVRPSPKFMKESVRAALAALKEATG